MLWFSSSDSFFLNVTCKFNSSMVDAKVASYTRVQAKNSTAMQTALVNSGPLAVQLSILSNTTGNWLGTERLHILMLRGSYQPMLYRGICLLCCSCLKLGPISFILKIYLEFLPQYHFMYDCTLIYFVLFMLELHKVVFKFHGYRLLWQRFFFLIYGLWFLGNYCTQ
jgi:hypothetical protein